MSKLDECIKLLLEELNEEVDYDLHDALAIMLTVKYSRRECGCGKRHEWECEYCQEPLCSDCDVGTVHDECSVCSSCKDKKSWYNTSDW